MPSACPEFCLIHAQRAYHPGSLPAVTAWRPRSEPVGQSRLVLQGPHGRPGREEHSGCELCGWASRWVSSTRSWGCRMVGPRVLGVNGPNEPAAWALAGTGLS